MAKLMKIIYILPFFRIFFFARLITYRIISTLQAQNNYLAPLSLFLSSHFSLLASAYRLF